jgi:1-aminocyclopropane-1-carboxylate synthase
MTKGMNTPMDTKAVFCLLLSASDCLPPCSNAGLFVWLDLSPYLPLVESSGDGWAAEKKLAALFEEAGVLVDSGEAYTASQPGGFRLVHTVKESTVTEGIRR